VCLSFSVLHFDRAKECISLALFSYQTASVRSIINELQDEQASGNLPEFNFIALNGMEMRSPFDSYVKFWEALSGTRKERLSAGAAAAKLEEYFGDGERDESNEERSKKPITVLMLDEIDYLVTKKQTILYNFFDWPLRATNARLIVIGISNTINLPERLSLKLQSRLGGERCHFKSYTVDETVAILKTRLDGDASEVFDEDAIKFASRKTGNLSGDIRKAFHMCKVAAQNAFDDYASGRRRIVEGSHPKVKISDVQRGSRDMYTSIIHKAISCSSSYEALVLIAIGALKKAKVGKDIVSLDVQEMLTKIESIANGSGEERYLSARLSLGDLLGILSRLGDVSTISSRRDELL
jgi:origin recognition complex subunit 1